MTDKYGYRAPAQDLAGVKTWVEKEKIKKPAPEKGREQYEDGKPQRDRVLPLPSGHPEGRDVKKYSPGAMNTPSDSQDSPLKPSKPYAQSNKPMGKPVHKSPRTTGVPGEQYGHPYIDMGTIVNQRRTMTASDEILAEDLEGDINFRRHPQYTEKQRNQQGQVKRYYKAWYKKNKRDVKRRMRKYNRENRVDIKRYNKKRNDAPEKHTRLKSFGDRSIKERNKEAMIMRVASVYLEASVEKEARPKSGPGSHSGPGIKRRRPMRGMAKIKARQSYIRNRINRLKYQKKYYKKNKRKIEMYYKRASDNKLMYLQMLLSGLRAAHFAHWTTHWQVKGQPFYGDHLLMERLYTSIVEDIDTLAEKIVGMYGSDAVEPVSQMDQMSTYIRGLVSLEKDPLHRAYLVEQGLQELFTYIYNKLEGQMSLGMDDYIMSTANAHETNVYLLKQRHS